MSEQQLRYETLQLHAGYAPDPVTGARQVPIYATTSYQFRDSDHAARLFALQEFGNIYSRITNPTTDVLEKRIAALEGGVAGLATSSGHAAQFLTFTTLAQAGDNLVSTPNLYGGSINQLKITLPRVGIEARFTSRAETAEEFLALTDGRTRAWFIEAIGNPALNIPDFDSIFAAARKAGVAVVVDNTFGLGGYLFRPLEWGAALATHSATKLRAERLTQNALELAAWLPTQDGVAWVNYPGLPAHPSYGRARRYFKGKPGGVLTFGLKGGYPAARTLIDRLELISHLANVGDARTLAIHPASTTHSQLSPEDQAQAGVSAELVRLSVGLEHIEDLKADLAQALNVASAAPTAA